MSEKETGLSEAQAIEVNIPKKAAAVHWKIWMKAARPFSLNAAITPVLVGTAVAERGRKGLGRARRSVMTQESWGCLIQGETLCFKKRWKVSEPLFAVFLP